MILGRSYSWCAVVTVTQKNTFLPLLQLRLLDFNQHNRQNDSDVSLPWCKRDQSPYICGVWPFDCLDDKLNDPRSQLGEGVPPQHSCGASLPCFAAITSRHVPMSPAAGSSAEAMGCAGGVAFTSPSEWVLQPPISHPHDFPYCNLSPATRTRALSGKGWKLQQGFH